MKIYPIYLFVLVLSLFSCQENFTKRLERETKLMTERECPKKFDDITVLDSVVFHDDGTNDYKLYYSKLFSSLLMYVPRLVSCSLIPNFSRTTLLLL